MSERVLSREQVRAVDRAAMEQLHIPGLLLMENAARGTVEIALEAIERMAEGAPQVAVLCGGGNNGGDGYAAARHLHNAGCAVALYAAKAPSALKDDAAVNAEIVQRMGLPVHPIADPEAVASRAADWADCDLLLDALLGTGFSGAPREPVARVIAEVERLRERSARPWVGAVDVPSGLDCDTGAAEGGAVRADFTVTFVARKRGFDAAGASAYTGAVRVTDIGAPPELIEQVVESG
jgi:NAD(P)H-hydrate epimerase